MDQIKAAWKGDEKLWKVFWIYNWLIGTALSVGLNYASQAGLIVLAILSTFGLVWGVFVYVALWRCAFNSGWKGWGYITRTYVVIIAIGLAASFFVDAESL